MRVGASWQFLLISYPTSMSSVTTSAFAISAAVIDTNAKNSSNHDSKPKSAMTQVLNNTELLEQILLHLSPRKIRSPRIKWQRHLLACSAVVPIDLFVATTVNRTFRSVVEGSLSLHKAMLGDIDAETGHGLIYEWTNMVNPILLLSKQIGLAKLVSCEFEVTDIGWEEREDSAATPPTLLVRLHRPDKNLETHATYPDDLEYSEEKASWQTTPLTNFPATVRVRLTMPEGFNSWAQDLTYTLPGKHTTLGELWDLTLHVRKQAISDHWWKYPSLRHRHYRRLGARYGLGMWYFNS